MREQNIYQDKPSRYQAWSNKPIKPFANTIPSEHSSVSKSNQQSEMKETTKSKSSSAIAQEKGDGKGGQTQMHKLHKLINIFQSQQNITSDQIAKSLGINVDAQTTMLLNNVKDQLMMAVSDAGKNPSQNKVDRSGTLSSSMVQMQNVSSAPPPPAPEENALPSSNWPPTDENDASNDAPGSIREVLPVADHQLGVERNDKHAGVKAALANLLSQQGIGVKIGGNRLDTSSKSNSPHIGQYQPQPFSDGSSGASARNYNSAFGGRSSYSTGGYFGDHSQGPVDGGSQSLNPYNNVDRSSGQPSRNASLLGNPHSGNPSDYGGHHRNPYDRDHNRGPIGW